MSPALRYTFVAFFALCAVGLLVFAYRLWRNSRNGQEQREPKAPEDEESLK